MAYGVRMDSRLFAGVLSHAWSLQVGRIEHPSLQKWQYIFLILGAISLSCMHLPFYVREPNN